MIDTDFRPLADFERKLLLRLCDQEFVGREETLKQIEGLEAMQVDEHGALGCLEFRVKSPIRIPKKFGCPVEGVFYDEIRASNPDERIPIELFLHVVEGQLDRLEVVSHIHDEIRRYPDLGRIKLETNWPLHTDFSSLSPMPVLIPQEKKSWFRRWFSLP